MHARVLIIGSGPAGYTAGIYTTRAGLQTTLLAGHAPGGQLMLTHEVENYPGFSNISGIDLMERFKKQAEDLHVDVRYESAISFDFSKTPFQIQTDMKTDYSADSVILAMGSIPKWLDVPGEEKFKGKGIAVCATCDGFFYKNKEVAVIGGGNSGVYEALFLSQIVKKVTLIHQGSILSADKILTDKLLKTKNIHVLLNTATLEFQGMDRLNSLKLKNLNSHKEFILPVQGAFIAIGHKPNTHLLKKHVLLDKNGYIVTQPNKETSVRGVFACGDIQEPIYRQAIIAAGSGCVAALSAEKYLWDIK